MARGANSDQHAKHRSGISNATYTKRRRKVDLAAEVRRKVKELFREGENRLAVSVVDDQSVRAGVLQMTCKQLMVGCMRLMRAGVWWRGLTNETRELIRRMPAIWDACWELNSSLTFVIKSYASMSRRHQRMCRCEFVRES